MSRFNKRNYLNVKSLFIVGLLFCEVLLSASCKSNKKRSTGTPSAPVSDPNTGDAGGECAASLTVLSLGPADPATLKLKSVDMEAFAIGAFNSARVVFELAEGSPRPSKYVYTASSANIDTNTGKKAIVVGSTSTPTDINSRMPTNAVSLKAWACISGDRLPGANINRASAEQQYQSRKLSIPELGTYYFCGDPVTHYDHQTSNASTGKFGTLQEEIDSLRRDAEKTAFQLVSAIGDSMKGASLAGGTGVDPCSNVASPEERAICTAVENPELAAELYVNANSLIKDAAEKGANYAIDNPDSTFSLTKSPDGSPCIPAVPQDIVDQVSGGGSRFQSPPVVTPNPISSNESTTPAPQAKPAVQKTPAVASSQDEVDQAGICETRSEYFQAEGLGSAVWDDELKRCFHVRDNGVKTLIDVSIDPESLNPTIIDEESVEQDPGPNGWERAGTGFMWVGGLMAAGGGAFAAYSKFGPAGSTSNSVSQSPTTTHAGEFDKSHWRSLDQLVGESKQTFADRPLQLEQYLGSKKSQIAGEFQSKSQKIEVLKAHPYNVFDPIEYHVRPGQRRFELSRYFDPDSGELKTSLGDKFALGESLSQKMKDFDEDFGKLQALESSKKVNLVSQLDMDMGTENRWPHANWEEVSDAFKRDLGLGWRESPEARTFFAKYNEFDAYKGSFEDFLKVDKYWSDIDTEINRIKFDSDLYVRRFEIAEEIAKKFQTALPDRAKIVIDEDFDFRTFTQGKLDISEYQKAGKAFHSTIDSFNALDFRRTLESRLSELMDEAEIDSRFRSSPDELNRAFAQTELNEDFIKLQKRINEFDVSFRSNFTPLPLDGVTDAPTGSVTRQSATADGLLSKVKAGWAKMTPMQKGMAGVAAGLGVMFVGYVTKEGGKNRQTIQLTNSETGYHDDPLVITLQRKLDQQLDQIDAKVLEAAGNVE